MTPADTAKLTKGCRRLIKQWRDAADTLTGAFECDGYARLLRVQATELEKLLPKPRRKEIVYDNRK